MEIGGTARATPEVWVQTSGRNRQKFGFGLFRAYRPQRERAPTVAPRVQPDFSIMLDLWVVRLGSQKSYWKPPLLAARGALVLDDLAIDVAAAEIRRPALG